MFTKHLLDGLEGGADEDHLGFITLRDLYDYIYKNVTSQFQNQHPVLIGTLEGNTILKFLE